MYLDEIDDFCKFPDNAETTYLTVLHQRNIAEDLDMAKAIASYLLSNSYLDIPSIIYPNKLNYQELTNILVYLVRLSGKNPQYFPK